MAILNVFFPGSFDPITQGHVALVRRALSFCDHVVVGVGTNSDKQYMFSVQQRVRRIEQCFADDQRVTVCSYSDMTVDCCRREGCTAILRGVRDVRDYEYEQTIASVNHQLAPDIETIILIAEPDMRQVSSTLERERLLHGHTALQS